MKSLLPRLMLLAVFVAPMLVACGSPSDGAKDVLPPVTAKQKARKEAMEGGPVAGQPKDK